MFGSILESPSCYSLFCGESEPSVSELEIPVDLAERSYSIWIGSGNLPAAGQRLFGQRKVTHAVVITDENVFHFLDPLFESLTRVGSNVDVLTIEPGEGSKSVEHAYLLWEQMLAIGTDRKSVVLAVGGGVVGDLAGFVAATFARGLPFYQIGTTLLAQVDSSVGGKVGINLPGAKNIIGAFWQPQGVLIDTEMLESLPEREYRSGLAEVVKYGMILDAEFFEFLEQQVEALQNRDHAVLRKIIARSCELKAQVVQADEREESGLRAILNYGHTFAHAFETLTGYERLLHGEAVSIGMHCAAKLAAKLQRIDSELVQRQKKLLENLHLPLEVPKVDFSQILEVMQRDKKVAHGKLRFILPDRLGHVELVRVEDAKLVEAALHE